MSDEQQRQFQGFSRQAFRFLKDIKAHNDKAWFEAHRSDYEQHLLGPLRDLVTDLGDFMLGIDLSFEVAPAVMAQFRTQLDEEPQRFLKAIAWFDKQDTFALEGEQYRRPKGPDKPEPIRTWYNHKSFYLCCNRKNDEAIRSSQLVDDLQAGFGLTAPLYHYLLDTITRTKQPTR